MTDASVELWGRQIGAVSWLPEREVGVFQYRPEFVRSGIELAPLRMPLAEAPYSFPELSRVSFKGLPGLLADSLPDKFGNALIDAWLARQGRSERDFDPVERLCYTGRRGMGALEFAPALSGLARDSEAVAVDQLVELANRVLSERAGLHGTLAGSDDARVIEDILRVGTSAGGARAKAILAWNEATGEFRSGQVPAAAGFSHWLMKFDGIHGNADKELADPQGYGRIEYAYYRMAQAAGIVMMPCRLHEEGGRAHFMTRRFDRTDSGDKLHYQSLAALMHYDFNQAGAHSYEQALQAIRRLDLPPGDREQQVRRTYFNVLARNQDDHVKNIGFLMNRAGEWRLSPAFDVAYGYNPDGAWTSRHQMSLNSKRSGFAFEDLWALAVAGGFKRRAAEKLLAEVSAAVRDWPAHAQAAGVPAQQAQQINASLRTGLMR